VRPPVQSFHRRLAIGNGVEFFSGVFQHVGRGGEVAGGLGEEGRGFGGGGCEGVEVAGATGESVAVAAGGKGGGIHGLEGGGEGVDSHLGFRVECRESGHGREVVG